MIGYGNVDRGDDVAGLLVARRVSEMGFETQRHAGDGIALMELWRDAVEVVLIDAVEGIGVPGSLHVWDAAEIPLIEDRFVCSTHDFGVAHAIRLSRLLGQLPRQMRIYGITAKNVSAGSAMSLEVAAAVEEAAYSIATELRKNRSLGMRKVCHGNNSAPDSDL